MPEAFETVRVEGTSAADLEVVGAVVRIVDDEPGLVLAVDPVSALEDAGARSVTVTATMLGPLEAAAQTVTVTVGSGTATAGTDFAEVPAFTLTIEGSAESGTATFRLEPVPDRLDEGEGETVAVAGTSAVGPVGATQVTILDDDMRGVTVNGSLGDQHRPRWTSSTRTTGRPRPRSRWCSTRGRRRR